MKIYDKTDRLVLDISVDDNSYRNRAIMGDHSLTLYYALPTHVEIPVGAYCEYDGTRYFLLRPEQLKMKHTRNYEYTVTFSSDQEKAKIWKFRNPVDGRLKFPLTAKPKEHLQMVVDNMNRHDTGWTVGDCIDDVEKLVTYDHDYCWDALSKQATEFKTEFEVTGKRISMRKVEYNKSNPLPLSYGRGNGFKSGVGRSNSGDKIPVEILFVQGGERNIDRSKYPEDETLRATSSGCLLLPVGQTIGYDGEHFEDEDGYNPATARHYSVDDLGLSIRNIDKPLATEAEDSLDRSDDYPKRVGTISQMVEVDKAKNLYDFIDNTIPPNLNYEDYLIGEEQMTVIFQSGMLAGREFDVKYHHEPKDGKAGRRFEIVPQEIDGVMMPGDNFLPQVEDTYAIFHVMLPDAYIRNDEDKSGASWDMFRAAVKYLFDNEQQKYTFKGELDGLWAKKDWINLGARIKLGGYILFTSEQFEREGVLVRITGIKDYINNPHSPKIELSNETISGSVSATLKQLESTEVVIDENHRAALQFTKRRFRDARETIAMLEASLLENFTGSISPIAVQTMSMLVGDESLQFRFVNSQSNPSTVADGIAYNNEMKQLTATSRIIQHLTLGISSLSSSHKTSEYKFWTVSAYSSSYLDDPTKKYYLYIKANRNSQAAEYILSETAKKMEAEANYYYFLVGVLNSEYDGERSFVTLYGFSEILPGRITTDRVVSADGDSYFDMLYNRLKLGDALIFNSDGTRKLILKGTMVQSESGATEYIGCYRGVYNSAYTYYQGDEVSYNVNGMTSTYRYIYATPSRGVPPTSTVYWQVIAQGAKGQDGADGNYTELRFAVNGSTTNPPTLNTTALNPTGWSTAMPTVNKGYYLWFTRAFKTGNGGQLVSNWSTPVRMTAQDGKDGANGKSPVMVFRGQYDSSKKYYGNDNRLDAVKYGDTYYIARIDAGEFSTPAPPDSSKWNAFGASFESIATNLLLAEGANIGDWFISGGKIVSTLTGENKISLDAKNSRIEVVSASSGGAYSQENLGSRIDIDANHGIVEARSKDGYSATSYISPTGILSNRAGTQCVAACTGMTQRAAICGLGYGNLNKDDWQFGRDSNLIAGVYGYSSNSGTAPDYGGYFLKLKAKGLILETKYIETSGTYLTDTITNVVGFGSSRLNVYLPAATREGQTIFVKQWWSGSMRFYPRSGQKIYSDTSENEYYDFRRGQGGIFTFVRSRINGESVAVWLVSRWNFEQQNILEI